MNQLTKVGRFTHHTHRVEHHARNGDDKLSLATATKRQLIGNEEMQFRQFGPEPMRARARARYRSIRSILEGAKVAGEITKREYRRYFSGDSRPLRSKYATPRFPFPARLL